MGYTGPWFVMNYNVKLRISIAICEWIFRFWVCLIVKKNLFTKTPTICNMFSSVCGFGTQLFIRGKRRKKKSTWEIVNNTWKDGSCVTAIQMSVQTRSRHQWPLFHLFAKMNHRSIAVARKKNPQLGMFLSDVRSCPQKTRCHNSSYLLISK